METKSGCGECFDGWLRHRVLATLYYYPQSRHSMRAKAWGMASNRTQAFWYQSFVHPSAGADVRLARIVDLEDHRHMLRHGPWFRGHRPSRCLFLPRSWRHGATNVPPCLPLAASCKPSSQRITELPVDSCQTSNRLVPSCRSPLDR
jgi:hypothetical protein